MGDATHSKGPVLILSGSMRRPSVSFAAASAVMDELGVLGVPCRHINVRELDLPIFDPAVHLGASETGAEWIEAVRGCGAMVWVSPGYHRSMSGGLKNALDFLEIMANDDPPYLKKKFVGLVACSIGYPGALHTLTAMIHAAHALRAFVVPNQVVIAETRRVFDETTETFTSDRVRQRLQLFSHDVAEFYSCYMPEMR